MKISIIGSGYVGLVTGVSLAEIGHDVTSIDIDKERVEILKKGSIPIHEPGLAEMMLANMKAGRLRFTDDTQSGVVGADIIYLAVGTPQLESGEADMQYVYSAAKTISENVSGKTIVVVKSTVPVGENRKIEHILRQGNKNDISIVSNPEFLREGTALYDVFNGERIVIGSDDKLAIKKIVKINEAFNIPVVQTDLETAEMIKYAANAFLATKITFINEIANLCEKLGANVADVSRGIGMDKRIGRYFLQAGIGYGGSCFPKDTNALCYLSDQINYDFRLLKEVVKVNKRQPLRLVDKLMERYSTISDKKIAVLGLTFKPNTDDIRESPALTIIESLVEKGALVSVYDPIFAEKKELSSNLKIANLKICQDVKTTLDGAEAALVVTEWNEIKMITAETFVSLMKSPVVIDGRQCYNSQIMKECGVDFDSIGGDNRELDYAIEDKVYI